MNTSSTRHERPKVGVGVFVFHKDYPNCVLLGVRKNISGDGKYALPGGHLEFGEEWTDCGQREVLEETGLTLTNMKYCTAVNGIVRSENYHYVTLFVQGEVDTSVKSEPENLEPDKCQGWEWRRWDDFPPPDSLFCPLRVVRQQGYNPFLTSQSN
ncbi:hypothetical protein FSP39_013474 [Pinctada imbricata]|uniref:Nucleotide triphosphate diphosphatase NUDT15 n=1 Tax=Pinctada imbricata TaxID=66713 RepID=A0AA88YET8_PINIB|nr:hypothetical protein FSP39_013474 [Pinctada imbricata]